MEHMYIHILNPITFLLSHGHFIFVKAQALLFKQPVPILESSLPCNCHLDLQVKIIIYVTGFAKRDLVAHFFKIELLLP